MIGITYGWRGPGPFQHRGHDIEYWAQLPKTPDEMSSTTTS